MGSWDFMMGMFWGVFVVLVLLAVVYAFLGTRDSEQGGGPSGVPPADRESPREIIDRRFAEGELSREEYQQKRDELES